MLYFIVFFPMISSLVCWFACKRSTAARNIIASAVSAAELAAAVQLLKCGDIQAYIPWVCGFGINMCTGGFRKLYLLIICFAWFITTVMGNEYFSHYTDCGRYYFFNLMTLGATAGVFLSADMFSALIFFEIMSFTSFTWVAQEENTGALRAADTYLAIAVIGGLTALMGLFLLQHALGTTAIDELYSAALGYTGDRRLLYAAGGCILLGFGAKAGMFPLHIWLPKAHPVAPAPSSALLSGILTKSGIFGMLVISCELFRYDPVWGSLILLLGTVTMFLGALLAVFSIDLKRTLACSSVSQIGFIMIGIGMMGLLREENALAGRGTLLHMMNHSMFKLVLFTAAGVIYMNLHKLDLNDIRGFGRNKPLLMLVFLMGALGISGVPLFSGYVSKTLLHESIVEYAELLSETGRSALGIHAVEWIFLISGGMTAAYMTKLFIAVFIEKNNDAAKQAEYDMKKNYMKPLTAGAELAAAALIPFFGITASFSMDAIAGFGTDFMNCAELEHKISYFSLGNLKGSAISLVIGALLYIFVIRRFLMEKAEGGMFIYVNRWPAWADIEDQLYRPALDKLAAFMGAVSSVFGNNLALTPVIVRIPRAAGLLAHIICDIPDGLVYLLRRSIYTENSAPVNDKVASTWSYRLGEYFDRSAVKHGAEAEGSHTYARALYRSIMTIQNTTERIFGGFSFAMLMLCIALCFIFIYVS